MLANSAFALVTALSPSPDCLKKFYDNVEKYKKYIILRPQEVANSPEVARRIGVIAMNTAIEVDIYGNVNSTHICGTKIMNGIGGSGDYARNGYLTVFFTTSLAKGGAISSVVPFCSHVDHTEHDVDVIVSERGVADLRGLSPKERALVIIDKLLIRNINRCFLITSRELAKLVAIAKLRILWMKLSPSMIVS